MAVYKTPEVGYLTVTILGKHYFVHRLVATTFIGLPTAEKWQVNHIDRDRGNNQVANLEYVSPAENIRHRYASESNRLTSTTWRRAAVEWHRSGDESMQKEAALRLSVSQSSVSLCCPGKSETAFGNGVTRKIRWASQETELLEAGETWKPAFLPGSTCPILDLMVSNYGRTWSKSRQFPCGYTTCGSLTCDGYRVVKKGGKALRVHRLVAATFLGQPESPDLVVNHRDSDRTNNHVRNLEYVTKSQNLLHAYSQGRRNAVGSSKPVQARLTLASELGPWLDFGSLQAASHHTGLSPYKINRLCQGHTVRDATWEFRLREAEALEGEEWRPVVLEGARWMQQG
ncbi:unnamed protein product [Symbiodinium natans]|uniref:HNH nuclease domain-containing protein n=1 Tax=Symbiodinium natans TaxID=878477 RepID=A0A812PNU3_9DINO|nr:unnamed protein product [Symbiodinium natans]